MLNKPACNREMYQQILERGLERFPDRKKNYFKYLEHMENIKNIESFTLDYMPIKMDYEVSSICNFRCKMCLMSELSQKRPPNMTYEDFKQSIDEQYGLVEVKLQGLGEPLLNKNFFEMAEYVIDRDIWARTTTNASVLHINDNYKRLIDIGMGEIQISIDGATKETFEGIRVGSDFQQIVDNVKLLNSYAETRGELWRTSCWMLVQKENVAEMEEVLRLAASLGFTRFVYQMSLNDFGKDNWKKINGENTVNSKVDLDDRRKLTALGEELGVRVTFWDNEGNYKEGEICPWPFNRAYITAEMEISPCCQYWDKDVCHMGSARTFVETWNGKRYQWLRSSIINSEIPDICKRCYGMAEGNDGDGH